MLQIINVQLFQASDEPELVVFQFPRFRFPEQDRERTADISHFGWKTSCNNNSNYNWYKCVKGGD